MQRGDGFAWIIFCFIMVPRTAPPIIPFTGDYSKIATLFRIIKS